VRNPQKSAETAHRRSGHSLSYKQKGSSIYNKYTHAKPNVNCRRIYVYEILWIYEESLRMWAWHNG